MKNIVFMGTPSYAEDILKAIVDSKRYNILSVFTQPDKPFGRKKDLKESEVKKYAKALGLKLYQPSKLGSSVVSELVTLDIDYIVVAAYGKILPKSILNIAPCINLHASILPLYRGASPIHQSLINGDDMTGVTAMCMDEHMDTGDILKIKEIDIVLSDDINSLYLKLSKVASFLTIDVLDNFSDITKVKQDNGSATYCKKITKNDGIVDFIDASNIYNLYRAFKLWPTIYIKSGTKLKDIELNETSSINIKYQIISYITKDYITVLCKKGSLNIRKIQSSGKKEIEAYSYCNGNRLKVGDMLI